MWTEVVRPAVVKKIFYIAMRYTTISYILIKCFPINNPYCAIADNVRSRNVSHGKENPVETYKHVLYTSLVGYDQDRYQK